MHPEFIPGAAWKRIMAVLLTAGVIFVFYLALALRPAAGGSNSSGFEVQAGDGFGEIGGRLEAQGIIRSAPAFKIFSVLSGSALRLKPGKYILDAASTTPEIVDLLARGAERETTVVIPDGASLYFIDKAMSDAGVLEPGEFINYVFASSTNPEGGFFPDTYRFFLGASPAEVVRKLQDNFRDKALPLLAREPERLEENLVLASIVEKEVPDYEERRIVAGILKKRLRVDMPLQADATICYAKQRRAGEYVACGSPYDLDLKLDSAYNTYLYKGLPPGPIGNPGSVAIRAVMESVDSPYWFYLSDPETHRTVFAKTLEEHTQNRAKYLW